jgi:hypothetical protein
VSEIIREIWVRGFDRLKFEEIQLQNLPQSNYTTFFSNLSFPFSREEARILSEVIIDQRKFEVNNEDCSYEDKLEHFAGSFNKKSKLGKDLIAKMIDNVVV